MKFFYNPTSSNSRRALVAIMLSDRTDIERIRLEPSQGELATPEFDAINPNRLLPALQDGEFTLWESNAIMQYVSRESSLWPAGNARYDIARWQFWTTGHFAPPINTLIFERAFKESFGLGPKDEAVINKSLQDLARYATVLDNHLQGREYLVGNHLTLADLSVCADLSFRDLGQIDLSPYPNIQAWSDRLDQIEAWRTTAIQL